MFPYLLRSGRRRACRLALIGTTVAASIGGWGAGIPRVSAADGAEVVANRDVGEAAAPSPARPDPATLARLAAADQDLFLEVVVNGSAQPGLSPMRQIGGELHASVAVLVGLGISQAALGAEPSRLIALSRLPGARVDYDAARQRLALDVAPELLATTRVAVSTVRHGARADPGAVLNYDAFMPVDDAGAALRVLTDGRVFGDWGVLSSTSLIGVGEGTDGFTRLDTTFTRTDQARMRSVRAGDVISGSLGGSRAVRMGGFQVQRRFSARPDLITYPLPAFAGEAAVPSSVDLYVNQVHQFAGQVPGGPFVIDTAPALTGAGEATIVVRDVLGRENTLSVPLYVAPQMLARGLSDYSASFGWLREDYGTASANYRPGPVGSASGRYGWRDWMTVEGHVEGAGDLALAAVGVQVRLGQLGVVSSSVAASGGDGGGGQVGLGYQYDDPRFSVIVDTRRTGSGFRDLAALTGAGIERGADRVLLSVPAQRWGTWSLGYLRSRRELAGCEDAGSDGPACTWQQQDSRIATVGWSRTLPRRMSLHGNLVRDLERSGSSSVHLGLAFAFGDRGHGSIDAGRSDGTSDVGASFRRRADYDGGWQWGIDARRRGSTDAARAHGGFLGRLGEITGGIDHYGNETFAHLGARGALAMLGGTVLAGRQIHDAFAVVSTDGVAGVPVLHENRELGRTGRDGHLLVPDLAAWIDNRIGVDPLGMPLDRSLSNPEIVVAPREQSGVIVRFTAERYDGAVVRLVDSTGTPLPPGSGVWLVTDPGRRFIAGYDGVVFLTGLPAGGGARLAAQLAAGECVAEVPSLPASGGVPDLGRLECR